MDHGVARLAPHVQVSGAGQRIAVLVGASALVCQKAAFEGLFRFQSRYGAVNGAAGRRILPQTGPQQRRYLVHSKGLVGMRLKKGQKSVALLGLVADHSGPHPFENDS